MNTIIQLPESVTSKIAAGEVIERPVSVFKELIENSIDAGATSIEIELSEGGKSLIRVKDNGCGVRAEEIPMMVENFSTSKIKTIEDIERINSLGFRGEALASIKAVSNLTIRSKFAEESIGREISWSGNRVITDKPYQMNTGTEVIVRDLFFNLPARRKFLGSSSSESRRIAQMLNAFALSFPEVSFKLSEDGKVTRVFSSTELGERVEEIVGYDVFEKLTPVTFESSGIRVSGFVSTPDYTRGNRTLQYSFVNGRYIKNKLIYHAIQQAYTSTIPANRFPVVIIFISISPEEIDVNVHPSKAEIRFRDERTVHRILVQAIRSAIGIPEEDKAGESSIYRGIIPPSWAGTSENARDNEGIIQTGETIQENLNFSFDMKGAGFSTVAESPASLFDEENGNITLDHTANLYWQLHNSFILIQIRNGMVIVDQHAAHERVLYDRAVKSLAEGKASIQSLLFPATIELSPEEYINFEELSEILPLIGFDIEAFGLRTILVRGIPAGVKNWEDGRLVQEILAPEGRNTRRFVVDDFLKNYACKSAIKAGMKLSLEEMQNLIDSLFATDFPFTCPHGRPTMLRVSLADLERKFHRSVK